jgi:hypothetical protein
MKTKNFLLTGALLIMALFSVNGVMAEGPAESGQTTVTISLEAMQAITVNQSDVLLEYKTINDYSNGVDITMENHLTVYSVGGFEVKVKSDGDFNYTGEGTSDPIPASHVEITATPAGGSPGNFTQVTLSNTGQLLISSTTGGFAKDYNVNYSNKVAGDDFAYAGKEGGTYTAVVTYNIYPN